MNRGSIIRAVLAVAAVQAVVVSGWVSAAPRIGRAVVARMRGSCEYVYPDTTAHDYPKGRGALREGMALSEPQSLLTGKDGRMCVVLTPGAILCVAPETQVKLEKLEQVTEGLPATEKDLVKRIVLDVSKGAILLYAGLPSPTMNIEVKTPVGSVKAAGGRFTVSQEADRWVIHCEAHEVVLAYDGGEEKVPEGKTIAAKRDPQTRKVVLVRDEKRSDFLIHAFDICRTFFRDLEAFVFRPPEGVDTNGLADWIGGDGRLVLVGDPSVWHDVSPSFRIPPTDKTIGAIRPGAPEGIGIWGEEEIWAWYREVGILRGVNYLPRTAVNSTEMWQKETFDPKVIDEELGWARKAGLNSVRVSLQYLVWKQDPAEYRRRIDRFLTIARDHGLTVVFVLFDDSKYSGKDPYLGKQDDPVPGVYNSAWTPSPASTAVSDRAVWADLERYVKDVVGAYKRDRRVLLWDLYHMPGTAGLGDKSLPLLESVFKWARSIKPRQPLTAGPWTDFGGLMSARIMELSDVITIQAFDDAAGVRAKIMACRRLRRPVICTDWLKRHRGSTVEEILPVFAKEGVGWYVRGLVKGRGQWWIPEEHKKGDPEPAVWQQDLMHPDGKAYNRKEIELIQGFTFQR